MNDLDDRLEVLGRGIEAVVPSMDQVMVVHRRHRRRRIVVAGAVAAILVALAGSVALLPSPAGEPSDLVAASGVADPPSTLPSAPPSTPPRAAVPRVAAFGDSTALMTALGLARWARESTLAVPVEGSTQLACGIARRGEARNGNDSSGNDSSGNDSSGNDSSGNDSFPIGACQDRDRAWGEQVRRYQPEIAVVQSGPWDVRDHRLEGDAVWRRPGDPIYDEYLRSEMIAAVDILSAEGSEVIWLTSPPVRVGTGQDAAATGNSAEDPARMERLNQLINELPRLRPGKVRVVDLAGWLAASGEDRRLRPDGVHFSSDTSEEVARRWLLDAILQAYRQN